MSIVKWKQEKKVREEEKGEQGKRLKCGESRNPNFKSNL